jgi:glutamine synthetase
VGESELVALVCSDLGAIARGRSVPARDLDLHLGSGVGWVPANHALTPLGPLAEPNPFDSTGDLRLLPVLGTRARVPTPGEGSGDVSGRGRYGSRGDGDGHGGDGEGPGALDMVLCDIVQIDGTPWECCPRRFLADALAELADSHGLRLSASFEHEFQLLPGSAVPQSAPPGGVGRAGEGGGRREPGAPGGAGGPGSGEEFSPPPLPFSLDASRRAEPFPRLAMAALRAAGVQPERVFAEYAPNQFEIPVSPAEGVTAADRSVVLTEVVRDLARRRGRRATFTPLLDSDHAGNGVHIHLSLVDLDGEPVLYDEARPGRLSELGGRFAAGILLHAPSLVALTAPSPISSLRLAPHRWSAGAVCLGLQNRETVLRLPPVVTFGGAGSGRAPGTSGDRPANPGAGPDRADAGGAARQLHLEYRAADASANPYLALGAIVKAGMHGVEAGLPAPPILDRDPSTLDPVEAGRFGVGALPGSLEEALQALAKDDIARGWLSPLLYDAYLAVRRADLRASADWDLAETLRRYAHVY